MVVDRGWIGRLNGRLWPSAGGEQGPDNLLTQDHERSHGP